MVIFRASESGNGEIGIPVQPYFSRLWALGQIPKGNAKKKHQYLVSSLGNQFHRPSVGEYWGKGIATRLLRPDFCISWEQPANGEVPKG